MPSVVAWVIWISSLENRMNQTSAPCSRDYQHLIKGLYQQVEQYIRRIQDELCPDAINTSSFSPFKTLQCSSDSLMRDDSIQKVNGWFWCIRSGFSFEIWVGDWGGFTGIALMSSVEAALVLSELCRGPQKKLSIALWDVTF